MNQETEMCEWVKKLYKQDATLEDVMQFFKTCRGRCIYCHSDNVIAGHFHGYDRKCETCGAEFWLIPRGGRLNQRILEIINKTLITNSSATKNAPRNFFSRLSGRK